MIRNIIFDWSGTLVDDLPAVLAATNHVFARAGRPAMTLEEFRAEFCLPFTHFYDKHAPHVPLQQLEDWFHAYFKKSQHLITDLPFAREFLIFCQSKGVRMFVLSTIHEEYFFIHTRQNGFSAFFERAYLAVRDKRAKIGQVLFENRLNARETLFVGDMQHDIDTARDGGMHSCGVLTGYNRREQLLASKPDLIVANLRDLRELLEANGMEIAAPQEAPAAGTGAAQRPVCAVDQIVIEDLGLELRVGVSEEERARPQRLVVRVVMDTEFCAAAAGDDLSRAIDYHAVCQRLLGLGRERQWKLIETLAVEIAELLLREFHPARVAVEVRKFSIPQARHVAARVTRPC